MDTGARQTLYSAHRNIIKKIPNPIMVKLFVLKKKTKHPPSTKSKSESNTCLLVPWLIPGRMITTWNKLSSNGCEPEPAGTQCKTLPAFSPMEAIPFSPKPKGAPYRLQQTLDWPHRLTAGAGPCFTVAAFLPSQESHPLKFLEGFSTFPSMHAFNIQYS